MTKFPVLPPARVEPINRLGADIAIEDGPRRIPSLAFIYVCDYIWCGAKKKPDKLHKKSDGLKASVVHAHLFTKVQTAKGEQFEGVVVPLDSEVDADPKYVRARAVYEAYFAANEPAIRLNVDALASANQVKRLNEKNIENFLVSIDLDKGIARELMVSIEHADPVPYTAAFATIPWYSYHTTLQSTSGLCKRVLAGLGDQAPYVFAATEVNQINASSDRVLNHGISDRAIAKVHAYLLAVRQLPENWYQGKKAVAMTDPGVYTGLLEFFRKFSEATSKASAGFQPKTTIGSVFSATDILGASRTFTDREAIDAELQNVGLANRVKIAMRVQKIRSRVNAAAEEAEAHSNLLVAQLEAINQVQDTRAQAALSKAAISAYKATLQGDDEEEE